MHELDPDLRAAIDEERGLASASQNKYKSLKLERGESALARFLPVQLGPRKTWFARIARHWVGKHPYTCIRQTSVDFGGDPKAACPLCEIEQKYAQSRSGASKKAAQRIGAYPKWLTYLFVWEITDSRGRVTATANDERYVPNEWWLSRDAFMEITRIYDRSLRSPNATAYGCLDPVSGTDFTISRDLRTYKYMREDPVPIIADKSADDIFDIIDAAMAKTKLPELPTDDELYEAAQKAEDFIVSARDEGGSYGDRDDDRRRPANDEPSRRTVSRREAPAHGEEDFDQQEAPPPSRRPVSSRQPEAEAGSSRRTVSRQPVDEGAAQPPSRRAREPEPTREVSRREAAPEPAARETPTPSRREAPPPPPGRRENPPPPPSRRAPPAAPESGQVSDDGEELPEERNDPAPPEPAPVQDQEAPPPVSVPQRRLSANLRSSVARIGASQV